MTMGHIVDANEQRWELRSPEDLIDLTTNAAAPRWLRLAAADELGRRGDPRPGVVTLAPAWCEVPAGAFIMGAQRGDTEAFTCERPPHVLRLPSFRMSRYPVTNSQWRHFLADDGYQEQRWWTADGWQRRMAHRWSEPRWWSETSWIGNAPNRPVVGVSWYEALAFAAWLSCALGYRVRVCTETQWEKAARGRDGRLYPCGDHLAPEATHAGPGEPATGAAAPVGCHPESASPWGVEDLVGNTYAWTLSRWGPSAEHPAFGYPYVAEDGREEWTSVDYRVVRGGAWNFPLRHVRCSYRGKDRPEEAFRNVGVRLVTQECVAELPVGSAFRRTGAG